MRLNDIEKILIEGGIESNEAKVEAKMLVKHFLGLDAKDLILNDEFEDDARCADLLQATNLRATTRRPIQHILGYAHFMGEDFIVNEHVLIPRDETEILVRKTVELINKKLHPSPEFQGLVPRPEIPSSPTRGEGAIHLPSSHFSPLTSHLKVLDIGTGSGCIACMIAKLTNTCVLGIDISTDALQTALDNSSKLGLFNKAILRKSDIFSKIHSDEKFDLIVSNPPYIPPSEKGKLQKEVEFDPESALFTNDAEGLEFYDKIINEAPDYLNENGYLLFELGIGQAQKVKSFMKNRGFIDISIEKDLSGIERVIYGIMQSKI